MPHVQITLLEGRTPEQKRKIVERVTETMVQEAGATRRPFRWLLWRSRDGWLRTGRRISSRQTTEVNPAQFAAAGKGAKPLSGQRPGREADFTV